ncbi:MAG: dihydroorotase [Thermoleophilia bacterium]|nr:dihydroorotase [Thermoleophilia bacterium]
MTAQLDHRAERSADVLLHNARLLDPASGVDARADLLVRGGTIAAIGDGLDVPAGTQVVEATGLHALPAFVDPHVHLRTPGREGDETIATGTASAAAGGYCAVLAQPNTEPVTDSTEVLRALQSRARAEAVVPTGFLAAVTLGQRGDELAEFGMLAAAGAAGFTDDGLPIRDANVLRRALQLQQLHGLPIALHEEDPALSAGGVMHEGAVSAAVGVAGIPSISESTMVARDALIAGHEGGHIHIQHVSAAESVAAIEHARQGGVRITAEVSPHHLTLTDEAARGLDPNYKMNPPVRSDTDRAALIDGLRRGVIDFIATDHAPHSPAKKQLPFEDAPFGIIGLECAFSVLYTDLVLPGVLDLELVVRGLSAGADVFGIARPRLVVDEPANIALVDLDGAWTVGENGYHSRSSNCPWHGRELRGRVVVTIAAGSIVHREPLHAAAGGTA